MGFHSVLEACWWLSERFLSPDLVLSCNCRNPSPEEHPLEQEVAGLPWPVSTHCRGRGRWPKGPILGLGVSFGLNLPLSSTLVISEKCGMSLTTAFLSLSSSLCLSLFHAGNFVKNLQISWPRTGRPLETAGPPLFWNRAFRAA